MKLPRLNGRHIALIGYHAARHSLRSGGGLIFLLMVLIFGLVSTQLVLAPLEMGTKSLAKEGFPVDKDILVPQMVEMGRPVVTWAIGEKEKTPKTPGIESQEQIKPWTHFLLDKRPALLSAILLIMLFGLPLLIPFLGFNQISGDVQSRGLRYLLLRTERANIFFGRFLGSAVFAVLTLAIVILIITLYLGLKIGIYSGGLLALWGTHGFFALALLTFPYIALCTWFSASIDSPFLSLTAVSVAIGGIPLFAWIASGKWSAASYVNFLLPWGIQNHLLHPDVSHVLGTAVACIGYTLVFLFIGYYHFEKRDL